MAAGFEVVIDQRALAKVMSLFEPDTYDLPAMYADMIEYFYAHEDAVFASRGASQAEKWPDNCPPYAAKKKKAVGHTRLLEYTGNLRSSLVGPGGPGGVRDITADGFTVGTNLPYARKHHEGTKADQVIPPPINMTVRGLPARPLLIWTEKDDAAWGRIVFEFFEAAVAKVAG